MKYIRIASALTLVIMLIEPRVVIWFAPVLAIEVILLTFVIDRYEEVQSSMKEFIKTHIGHSDEK